ncbi:hypothetical protein [uncultured Dubosiella sp.]|nr:hypothetical protein [uncultured Dubosiella sp.]
MKRKVKLMIYSLLITLFPTEHNLDRYMKTRREQWSQLMTEL